MKEDNPRMKKLMLVYKKTIQEVLKENERIKQMLNDPNVSNGDSFFVGDTRTSGDGDPSMDGVNEMVEEVFSTIKLKLSELFKEKVLVHGIEGKLNLLDRDISENRISLRDISSEDYIREIFESYIVDSKIGYIEYVEEAKKRSQSRVEALRTELEEVSKEIKALKEENNRYDDIYNSLLGTFLKIVKNKHNT